MRAYSCDLYVIILLLIAESATYSVSITRAYDYLFNQLKSISKHTIYICCQRHKQNILTNIDLYIFKSLQYYFPAESYHLSFKFKILICVASMHIKKLRTTTESL